MDQLTAEIVMAGFGLAASLLSNVFVQLFNFPG